MILRDIISIKAELTRIPWVAGRSDAYLLPLLWGPLNLNIKVLLLIVVNVFKCNHLRHNAILTEVGGPAFKAILSNLSRGAREQFQLR